MPTPSHPIFVGTSTAQNSSGRGIYTLQLDAVTGALTIPQIAAKASNPTFLAFHPTSDYLYALNELEDAKGNRGGALTAFSIHDGELAPLNSQPTGGGILTHVAVDATGAMAVVVSYGAGEISSFSLGADGRVGERASFVRPTGELGPNAKRQDAPHPHSVTLSPDNCHAYICDLGLDTVFCFCLDISQATLTADGETRVPAGAGPRHSKFSPDGQFFYVINELDSTICVFGCDAGSRALTLLQIVSTLPSGFSGESYCAEIQLSPDGRFIYGSNRGHDSLAVFSRHAETGQLETIEIVPCGGRHPRHFALSPDGRWMLCANRDSDNLVSFRVDADSGRLQPVQTVFVPQGTCVAFGETAL